MADVNTVVVVSDKQELVNQISQKLVLLRSLDKIKSCSIEEAQTTLQGFSPNVLILHCDNNNINALNLIKAIKKQDFYKNLPILLINENCSREIIIEAFDDGISDVLFMPIIDYELLIRVIWCLQKNELNLAIESRTNFLTSLGVVQSDTGVYAQKYCDEFLRNEIQQTKKYSQRACVLLVAPDKKYPNYKDPKEFIKIIKNSIRINDSVIIKDVDKFYVYLQKTKLNGAYSVFERINNNLGIDCGANAGLVEIQDQKYEEIIDALNSALEKALENSNSLIVASDFYSTDSEKQGLVFDNTPDTPLNSVKEAIKNKIDFVEPECMPNDIDELPASSEKGYKLFRQAYNRKLKVVINPIFRKYENLLRSKKQDFIINSYTGIKSMFNISNKDVSATFALEYDGAQKTLVKLSIDDGDKNLLSENETVEFTVLDYRRVSFMISELIDKFIEVLKQKN